MRLRIEDLRIRAGKEPRLLGEALSSHCVRRPRAAAPQDGQPLNFITGVALPVDGGALVDIN